MRKPIVGDVFHLLNADGSKGPAVEFLMDGGRIAQTGEPVGWFYGKEQHPGAVTGAYLYTQIWRQPEEPEEANNEEVR